MPQRGCSRFAAQECRPVNRPASAVRLSELRIYIHLAERRIEEHAEGHRQIDRAHAQDGRHEPHLLDHEPVSAAPAPKALSTTPKLAALP